MKKKEYNLQLQKLSITAKSPNQKKYLKTIRDNKVIFCYGPPGTGKTHIAVASAIIALFKKEFERLIISRPMVQAGERTGFLPGTIDEKMRPYLQPIYDEFSHYLKKQDLNDLKNQEIIELCPLAYMRGRNFHNSFVIVDEAQNISSEQLKMALTRLGRESKMVIVGDPKQSDIPEWRDCALTKYLDVLEEIEGIGIVELTNEDIVREPIVGLIVDAIEAFDKKEEDFIDEEAQQSGAGLECGLQSTRNRRLAESYSTIFDQSGQSETGSECN